MAGDWRTRISSARRRTAQLQAASPATKVLLRTSMDSGHGLDTSLSEQIAQQTDVYAFLFGELAVNYRAVK